MIHFFDHVAAERIAAIDSEGGRLSYGDLRAFGQELKELLPQRSLMFLLTENNIGGVAWIFGNLLSENVPLILNAHTDDALLQNLIDTYKPPYICVPNALVQKMGYTNVYDAYGYTLLSTGFDNPEMDPELSHLLPTSGSTGSPKLVRHMYSNIEAAALNISTFFGLTESDRPLVVLPLYYTMGLSIAFSHFKVGATLLVTGCSMTDARFWSFLKEEEVTSITGVPYSFQILNAMRIYRMKLPSLKLLTQGGGKMPRELNIRFAQWCQETGREWIATYGQSEGTARMAWLPPKWAEEKVGSIGIAVPNGELSLIDCEGNLIEEPNVEGEMCYRGKNVTMGYARTREDLQLGDERHGYMRTGDMAYRDADGCYYIVGRIGRFLKLFGKRVGLDETEQIVKDNLQIECACVGTDERMTVYITEEPRKQQVKELLVAKTAFPASVFEVVVIDSLPKNEAGKTLYSQLKSL